MSVIVKGQGEVVFMVKPPNIYLRKSLNVLFQDIQTECDKKFAKIKCPLQSCQSTENKSLFQGPPGG